MAKSKLLEQVRQEIRRRNYSYRTEQSYTSWVVRYVKFHGMVHPKKNGRYGGRTISELLSQ